MECKPSTTAVLVVDDDEEQLEYFKVVLDAHGFQVTTARTPREGLHLMRSRRFDVVVSDFTVPGADGGEFIKYLRTSASAPLGKRSGIILITNSLSINHTAALEFGANNFSEKKYVRDKLGGMIRELAGRAGVGRNS